MNILEEIAAKTRERVAEAKNKVPLEEMKQKAESLNADTGFPFENAIKEGSPVSALRLSALRDFRLKMPLKREVFLLYVRRKKLHRQRDL